MLNSAVTCRVALSRLASVWAAVCTEPLSEARHDCRRVRGHVISPQGRRGRAEGGRRRRAMVRGLGGISNQIDSDDAFQSECIIQITSAHAERPEADRSRPFFLTVHSLYASKSTTIYAPTYPPTMAWLLCCRIKPSVRRRGSSS
jgi:hypothetical protein